MSLIGKASSRRLPVEQGEEKLHQSYKFKTEQGKQLIILAGIDGGSTQTRLKFLDLSEESPDLEEAVQEEYVIPSISATVPDDRVIEPRGDLLYDLMDSRIINTDTTAEALFRNARIVRGSKFQDVELKENRLKSSTQKSADPTYYYNLIDDLGYGLCIKYGEKVPEKVQVYLSISLPPDDINEKNMQRLNSTLKSFQWALPEYGVKIQFEVLGITASTEPEAFVKAFFALSDQEVPENVLHIEGGGRSIGAEVLVNGQSLATAQKTLEYGGSQLQESLRQLYQSKYGGSPLKSHVLEAALRTGTVKLGNQVLDVTDLIRQAKDQLAEKIVSDLVLHVFDQQTRVTLTDLNLISVSGRLFAPTPYVKYDDHGNIIEQGSISLADAVATRFGTLSPYSKFQHIEGSFIPTGLLINGFLEFVGDGEEADQSAPDATTEAAAAVELPPAADIPQE